MGLTPDSPIVDLIGYPLVVVSAAAVVADAAALLAEHDIGALVVTDADGVAGILSERDVTRAVAGRQRLDSVPVAHVMSRPVVWVPPEERVLTVAERMLTERVRHVLVRGSTHPLGVVSIRDVLGVLVVAAIGDS